MELAGHHNMACRVLAPQRWGTELTLQQDGPGGCWHDGTFFVGAASTHLLVADCHERRLDLTRVFDACERLTDKGNKFDYACISMHVHW